MTVERRIELCEEVMRLRAAGHDPASVVKGRLFEICEELLQMPSGTAEETHEQWKQRMRETYNAYRATRVRRSG